jgi:hypothetical protein
MPRVKVGPVLPDAKTLDVEIGHLRELDVGALQARWREPVSTATASPARHLLFRVWPIGCRPIVGTTLMRRANDCSDATAS